MYLLQHHVKMAPSLLRPVHTTPEEFENGSFTLKKHQMFSVYDTTPEEFKGAVSRLNGLKNLA